MILCNGTPVLISDLLECDQCFRNAPFSAEEASRRLGCTGSGHGSIGGSQCLLVQRRHLQTGQDPTVGQDNQAGDLQVLQGHVLDQALLRPLL